MSIDWSKLKTPAIRQAEADEQAAAALRAERDRELRETDYTQLADFAGNKGAWAAYRQALRDLPNQAGFPKNARMPTKP
jgi:hypothetical protein